MREYTFDEEVTLIASDPDTGNVTKRRSYAEIVSVRGDETYKAAAVGLKPELLVVLPNWFDDYHGEETLEYAGRTYRVWRAFKTQDLRAELTVYRPKVGVSDPDTFL